MLTRGDSYKNLEYVSLRVPVADPNAMPDNMNIQTPKIMYSSTYVEDTEGIHS